MSPFFLRKCYSESFCTGECPFILNSVIILREEKRFTHLLVHIKAFHQYYVNVQFRSSQDASKVPQVIVQMNFNLKIN